MVMTCTTIQSDCTLHLERDGLLTALPERQASEQGQCQTHTPRGQWRLSHHTHGEGDRGRGLHRPYKPCPAAGPLPTSLHRTPAPRQLPVFLREQEKAAVTSPSLLGRTEVQVPTSWEPHRVWPETSQLLRSEGTQRWMDEESPLPWFDPHDPSPQPLPFAENWGLSILWAPKAVSCLSLVNRLHQGFKD